MRERDRRTVGDKAMIAVLSFAILLGLGFGVFAIVSMATHTFDVRTGLRALAFWESSV